MEITGVDILAWAGGTVLFGSALGILTKYFFRPAYVFITRANEFFDDWFGTPERAGVPARKGVMIRLADVEVTKADRSELADLVEAIANKAEREEVLALRQALDDHIRRMDELAG